MYFKPIFVTVAFKLINLQLFCHKTVYILSEYFAQCTWIQT